MSAAGVHEIRDPRLDRPGDGEDSSLRPPAAARTLYDRLQERVKDRTSPKPITLPVPGMEGVAVRYGAAIEDPELEGWTAQSLDPNERGDMTPRLFLAALILAYRCEAILVDGEPVTSGDGDVPVTFRNQAFRSDLGAEGAAVAARLFYGKRDGVLISHSGLILDAAGYTGQTETEVPTSGEA